VRTWQAGHAFLFFTVVTGFMLYPMFFDFFDKLISGGDAYEYIWKLWWFKHTLLETGRSPWFVGHIYYPDGYLLAYGESTPANTVLALPMTWLWGEIPTYNSLIFLSTVLSGFTMFLLAREVTGNFWAGLLAGIIFAFSPFRRLQTLHLNIVTTQWFPLVFYFLERFARTRKPGYGLAAGFAFGLNALASWYYALAGTLFVLIWALVRFRPLKTYLAQKQTWGAAAAFAVTAAVVILPFAWPYLEVLNSPDTAIPMENSNYYAASLDDYLIPSPFQFVWGDWVFQNLLFRKPDPGEFIIGWGFIAWLFGLYGWRFAGRQVKLPWLAVVLAAVVLSFGLTLHLVGRQVSIPAPPAIVERYNGLLDTISRNYALDGEPFTIGRDDGLVVPLPALLLRWFVPALGKARTWTRFGVIALFGAAVLAALGAAAWHQREILPKRYSPLKQRLLWGLFIGLALFELWWAPSDMITPKFERPVDRWLATQPEQFAIMEYPLSNAFTAEQLIYTRAHGKPIVHGYATYFSFVFSRQHPELVMFPHATALEQLAGWNVRYILIDVAGPGAAEAQALLKDVAAIPCLSPATIQDSVHVFELVDCGAVK
jgi:hypothetical protein